MCRAAQSEDLSLCWYFLPILIFLWYWNLILLLYCSDGSWQERSTHIRPFPLISAAVLYISDSVEERPQASRHSCQKPENTRKLNIESTKPWFPLLESSRTILGKSLLRLRVCFSFSVGGHLGLSDLVSGQLVDKQLVQLFRCTQWEDHTGIILVVTYCIKCRNTALDMTALTHKAG